MDFKTGKYQRPLHEQFRPLARKIQADIRSSHERIPDAIMAESFSYIAMIDKMLKKPEFFICA